MNNSPLRYPGGKNKLSAFIAKICVDNNITGTYVEPYAGGAAVALSLLFDGFINRIIINDKDRSIYAFWYSILNNTEIFCDLILNTEISIDEWRRQKEVQTSKETADLLDLGFSTFYLNRTNRSGIIKAGAIGGIKQTGDYLIDCRFNKNELIKRIKKIALKRDCITLYNIDAIELIDTIQRDFENDNNIIFYFDPPYYYKANSLYMNHYKGENHKTVSEKIKNIQNIKWVVSYDNVPEIQSLYLELSKKEYAFKHTAHSSRIGKEILFFSPTLQLPNILNWNPLNFKFIRRKNNIDIVYKEKKVKKELINI